MKVGILTHYDVNNQGAQLQMYALYNQFKKMGHSPKVLTYVKNYDFQQIEKVRNQVTIKSIPYFIKHYLLKKGIGSTLFNVKKYTKNKKFRLSNFHHENYTTADIECAVVGSDEVFSIPMGVNMMMYGHCVNTDNMISYAPSFGQTSIELMEKYHCKELISSGLSKFKNISARDKNTYNIVKTLTGNEADIVCDPVLLYDFSNTKTEVKLPNKKYLLVYAYEKNMTSENEVKAIKEYAKKNNLITVSAGTYHKWCDKNISCNCLEWIEYFRGAEVVVTDTFHGAIVSIISHTPMAVVVRDINTNKLTDLLDRTGTSDRRINQVSLEELERVFKDNVDFNLIESQLKRLRDDAISFLRKALK
ncbi:polysaccharide pyruvyl transferase family protein [uncultured Clostridium sp.]|uniref:polysaccharide pyruvyl transferase family protein n=1 Tax=uncultured Clostridium sp. TaxID=59620 RepID=UPI0028EE9005|nr:polysaccharide pyruvyl transferase family protein [uncultured Clostridium sp.]